MPEVPPDLKSSSAGEPSQAAFSSTNPAPPNTVSPKEDAQPVVAAPASQIRTGFGVWVRDLVISLAISAFIIIFLYQPVKVEGTSMMPSLQDQERIFVNKFVYRLEPIERGDIVVFRYPRDPSKSYIKRVIGMAGDHIRIDAGQVYVNGKALDEPYVPAEYADTRSYPDTIVPPDSYFVLGDHRSMSNDSRDFGSVNLSYIYGKAVFGYWPMDKLGRVR
ncbi:MAG TPA: signal peptidase I [Candidatus Sulfotelmatobacter sp.]|nr:signal peptidase I [Candidatus Sulfotelmatobacter sp.]